MSDDQHSHPSSNPDWVDEGATVIHPRTVPATLPLAGAELPVPITDLGNHLPLGTFLGEFEITGLIGEGGFGIVYLAQDHSLQRRVALKEYMPSALAARSGHAQVSVKSERHRETFEAGLQSFVNEARLLAQFDHASLVKVYRFWEANGTAYMIMPFYEGVTFKEWLHKRRSQPLKSIAGPSQDDLIPSGGLALSGRLGGSANADPPSEERLMALLGPLTEALQVIHAQQCYHRDIAPDNILLLGGSERPLLLDFGAARRVIGDMTQALTVILKPGYAPIEQYAEVPSMKQGPWTDVYALAAVVYYAIVGKTPPTSVGRLVRDSHQTLSSLQSVTARFSPRFVNAIDAALAVKPDERTQTIADLRVALGLDAGASSLPLSSVDFEIPQADVAHEASASTATRLHADQPGVGDLSLAQTQSELASHSILKKTLHAPSRSERSRWGWWMGGGAAALVAAGFGFWLVPSQTVFKPASLGQAAGVASAAAPVAIQPARSSDTAPISTPPLATAASTPTTAATTPPEPAAVVPPQPPASPLDWNPPREFQSVVAQQTPGFDVRAVPAKSRLRIQRDKLSFSVTSAQDGFVYVMLFGTDGKLIRLYPAGVFGNRIRAGQTLVIPPSSSNRQMDLTVTGPPGRDQLLVMVSQHPRRFNKVGMRLEGDFGVFPKTAFLKALQQYGGSQAFLTGETDCAQSKNPCSDVYGAAVFEVEEIN